MLELDGCHSSSILEFRGPQTTSEAAAVRSRWGSSLLLLTSSRAELLLCFIFLWVHLIFGLIQGSAAKTKFGEQRIR